MAAKSLPEMPCGPILELNGQRKRLHVPYGIKPLIAKIAEEVLQAQPDNIYDYVAAFMEARVRQRAEEEGNKTRRASWQVHRWSWEGTSILSHDELLQFLGAISTSENDANHYAVVIQKAYRGHKARELVKGIRKSKEFELSIIPRDGPKVDDDGLANNDDNRRKSWQVHRWSYQGTSVLSHEELLEFLGSLKTSEAEANRYAVVIQKAYRGHRARELVKEIRRSHGLDMSNELEQFATPGAQDRSASLEGEEGEMEVENLDGGSDPSPGESNAKEEEGPLSDNYYDSGNDNSEGQEEESDFDTRTYEVEEEEMNGFETTEEEEEESLPDTIPPPLE